MNDPGDARLGGARRILAKAGLADAAIAAVGQEGEILAISIAPARWPAPESAEAAALSGALQAVGFRYVALDLAPAAH